MADSYAGMTVNERLFDAGILDAYTAAIARDDVEEISLLLARVGLRRDADGMLWDLRAQ